MLLWQGKAMRSIDEYPRYFCGCLNISKVKVRAILFGFLISLSNLSHAQLLEYLPVLIIASLTGGEEWIDTDGDGTPDNIDDDIDGDGVLNADDGDSDGDGVMNDDDAFPNDASAWSDLDGDGIPDSEDPDRDGDGVANDLDSSPDDLSGAACL